MSHETPNTRMNSGLPKKHTFSNPPAPKKESVPTPPQPSKKKVILPDHLRQLCLDESKDFFLVKHPERVKQLGEVFTPTELVLEMIEQLPDEMFEDGRTFLDPTVGNGQFLAAIAIIKRELGHSSILQSVYGADIMEDNVQECRERLLDIAGRTPENEATVQRNIVHADGLRYHYRFDDSYPYDDEARQKEEEEHFNSLFDSV